MTKTKHNCAILYRSYEQLEENDSVSIG